MAGDAGRRVEARRLYQQTADQIRALIGAGTYRVDSRLPAERELALQLGVSRPSLREALIALEIEGSVEIRMGSGVYVRTPPEPPVGLTLALGDSPSELMQARVIIEGTLILQACARMAPATLGLLADAIGDMRAAVDGGRDPLGADRLFHETIAQQAGNAVLARIVGDLFEERHSRLFRGFSSRFEDRNTWTAALAEHEAILLALRAADPLRAQSALRAHLYGSAERWIADR